MLYNIFELLGLQRFVGKMLGEVEVLLLWHLFLGVVCHPLLILKSLC